MTYTVQLTPPMTTAHGRLRFNDRPATTNSASDGVQIPASQLYYWTRAWQANERLAAAELYCGEGVEFDNVDDALAWLRD